MLAREAEPVREFCLRPATLIQRIGDGVARRGGQSGAKTVSVMVVPDKDNLDR